MASRFYDIFQPIELKIFLDGTFVSESRKRSEWLHVDIMA